MAISYPLSLPNVKGLARISLNAASAVTVSRSPFSFASQIQKFSGQIWTADLTLPPMKREDAEEWISFILSLNGQEGTFLLGDQSASTPRGTPAGSPVINSSGQTGNVLSVRGWTPSSSNVLKAGDYIQVGQRLYKNLKDVSSDGSGVTSLDIWPRLRESPTDGTSVVTSNTVGLFRLAESINSIFSVSADRIYQIAFSAIEAL